MNATDTVDAGTMDWVKDVYVILKTDSIKKIAGIYRLTLISDQQFNIIAGGTTYSGDSAAIIIDDTSDEYAFGISAVRSDTVRAKIEWCLEYVSHVSTWVYPEPEPESEPEPEPIPEFDDLNIDE